MTKKERDTFNVLLGHMYNLVHILDKMEREKHRSVSERRQLTIVNAFTLALAQEISDL
jgi:hypothetical protein